MAELYLYRNALALVEHQNFGRAAKALNISQPTLSRRIQLLEKITGERLFERISGEILPTQAGEILLKHARIILASSKAMQEEIDRHQGVEEGSVCIGSGTYPASALLGPAIGRFNKSYPGINIEVSVDDWSKVADQLFKKDFDYVVMETSQLRGSRDFELTRLNRHQGFFYCRHGHPVLDKGDLTISDLSQFPLIHTTLPKRLSELFDRLFFPNGDADASQKDLKNIIVNDLGTMNSTVIHSDSIGIGTYGALLSELEAGILVPLPFCIPELRTGYDIVKRKGLSLSPAATAFIEVLLEVDKEQFILETDLIESLGSVIKTKIYGKEKLLLT